MGVTDFWWYPGNFFLIMVVFADLGRIYSRTLLNLTDVILLELRSPSPYEGTLRPSTPAPAGEAQILSDTIDINYKYLVKNLPDVTNEKLDVPGYAGLPKGLICT